MQVCTKYDDDSDLITGNPDRYHTETDEKRVSTVQVTERQKMIGKVATIEEFTIEQTKEAYCCKATTPVGMCDSEFYVYHNRILFRTSKIDDCLHKAVPVPLKKRILFAEHYPPIFGHPDERGINKILQEEQFWPHMANDVYEAVENSATRARFNRDWAKRRGRLQLFFASGLRKFIAMDTLDALPQTKIGNVFIIVMMDRYSKMTIRIPTSKPTATHIANVFLDHFLSLYGIPDHPLAKSGPQFVSKLFETLCQFLSD